MQERRVEKLAENWCGGGERLMIRLNKKEMDRKLKLIMEFVKVPGDKQERIQYATTQKPEKNS